VTIRVRYIKIKKISGGKKMPPKEKLFHIYAKDKCLFHNIKEEEFNVTWRTLKGMIGLMKTDYTLEDLSYEEVEKPLLNTEEVSY